MRWNDLMDYNMPQDLHRVRTGTLFALYVIAGCVTRPAVLLRCQEIEAQRSACATIMASKNKLISEFQMELRAKDEEYVKSLQKQRDEIEELIARMTEQFGELRSSYEVELEHIEDSFLTVCAALTVAFARVCVALLPLRVVCHGTVQEREELIIRNKKENDALFDKRRAMEAKFVEDRLGREAQYQEEIDEMQAKDAEDFNKLKIRLETDIQVLQQQLQHMQATYLLNTEKLDYNFRVLTEK